MSDLVLISTHRLPLAGRLREAFRAERFQVELIPGPDHLPAPGEREEEPALVVLTGVEGERVEAWRSALEPHGNLPVFIVRGEGEGEDADPVAARELGSVENFGPGSSPDEVALVGRRTVERRRLQRLTGIVGESEPIRELLERVVQIAPVDSTVLVTGESGTGKELVARGIHALSPRRHRSFLAVNVAALSETLLESELFGHEKGAFTGAIDTRKGFFELANRGTLFLDEIGEMPLSTQTKLLRVLEQREFLRVGGEESIRVDVRIVAATNRELRQLVATGEFRRDLYYRLNILDLHLPPLRERKEDIPLLIRHFVQEVSERTGRSFHGLRPEAMEVLVGHDWPGNVRELRNLVESMVVLAPDREIGPEDIPRELRPGGSRSLLPVPTRPRELRGREEGAGADDSAALRPELEFIFRTLVEVRMEMEELRREFDQHKEEVDRRLELESRPSLTGISTSGSGVEVGTLRHRGDAPFVQQRGERSEDGIGAGERSSEPRGSEPASPQPDQKDEDVGEDQEGIRFRPGMTMEEIEEAAIRAVLREVDGNRRKAAELLGIGERTLYRKIRKFDIEA